MTQIELKTHHNFQWVVLLSERSWFPVLRGILTGGILSVECNCSISVKSGAHMHCNDGDVGTLQKLEVYALICYIGGNRSNVKRGCVETKLVYYVIKQN